ncbi:hypothetical protein HAX54_021247, partial [Datura stramonium]|nr:hypothetical protein [Datura stramonium]
MKEEDPRFIENTYETKARLRNAPGPAKEFCEIQEPIVSRSCTADTRSLYGFLHFGVFLASKATPKR